MPPSRDPVELLALDLAGIKDADQRRAAFQRHAGALGVSGFAYLNLARPDGPPLLETDYPEQWVSHYIEQGFMDTDMVPQEARRSPLPFHWRSTLERPPYGPAARRVFDEAAAFGIHDGFAVPIHMPGGLALMSMVVNDGDLVRPETAARRQALHLLALHYHLACERSLSPAAPPPVALTPREREVLLWAAKGKTGWEIGQILKLSERTVTYHVENARAKLGATSRSHAVIKAVTLGLISP